MSDSGFDDNSQRRAAVEHAASITALNQKADRVSTAYRTVIGAGNNPPERTLDLPRGHTVPSIVTLDDAPPGRREALQRKLGEYRKRFEDGDVLKRALEVLNRPDPDPNDFPFNVGIPVPDNNPQYAIDPHQEKAILLQLLLDNGSLNFDAARQAFGIDSEEDEHELKLNYHLIYDYAKTGGQYTSGGTGLSESEEQDDFKDIVYKRIPDIWSGARKLASEVLQEQLKPVDYQDDDGKQMRARLIAKHAHVSSDEGGVIAELTETHNGVDVGTKDYVYLGYDWYTAHNKQTPHIYRAKKLGKVLTMLKEPLGFVSARDEDYPGVEKYWLTADSDTEESAARNTKFMEIVGTFGSLVEANTKTT